MAARHLFLVLCLTAIPSAAGQRRQHFYDTSELKSKYDYVVVGGGTSGLVVANRLTEDPKVDVLVIEVGQLDQDEPGVLVPGIGAPQKYWRTYNSTPQVGLNGRVSQLYTGEVVGGGTVINGMLFNRGSALDYDAWEELGNPGWGWNGLLPYFKKSENYTPATPEIQEQYPASPELSPHGTDGPVGSSYPPFEWPSIKNFFRAWASLGVLVNPQPNAGLAIGALHSPMSLTSWNMTRSSASSAYYKGKPSRRPNFHLLTGHRVSKVLFDGKRACGVEFMTTANSTTTHHVAAKREVIIAAGAARSPQILQLSGIGPRALLREFNISVVADIPGVGYNFQDQPSYYMGLELTNYTLPNPNWLDSEIANHTEYSAGQLSQYYQNRSGAYTITFESGSNVAFIPLRNFTDDYERIISDARSFNMTLASPAGAHHSVLRGHKVQQKILLRHYASFETGIQETAFGGGSGVLIFVHLKPLSRGSILINSTDPAADPVIDFGTFTHPTDLDIMIAALRKNRELVRSGPMQELGAVELSPGEDVQSDEQIAAVLREGTLSSWQHPVGTLAMMPRELGGVVDSELRVYGVDGLRVVDASIMPLIPASHTSSTVYAVAEKAADLIKASHCGHGQY